MEFERSPAKTLYSRLPVNPSIIPEWIKRTIEPNHVHPLLTENHHLTTCRCTGWHVSTPSWKENTAELLWTSRGIHSGGPPHRPNPKKSFKKKKLKSRLCLCQLCKKYNFAFGIGNSEINLTETARSRSNHARKSLQQPQAMIDTRFAC